MHEKSISILYTLEKDSNQQLDGATRSWCFTVIINGVPTDTSVSKNLWFKHPDIFCFHFHTINTHSSDINVDIFIMLFQHTKRLISHKLCIQMCCLSLHAIPSSALLRWNFLNIWNIDIPTLLIFDIELIN